MRKLIVHMEMGVVGTEACDALLVPEWYTNKQIDEEAWQMAVDHAESYGYYPRDEWSDDDDEDGDQYTDAINGWWEDYDPEKHDMLRTGGGSFADDFKQLEMIEAS